MNGFSMLRTPGIYFGEGKAHLLPSLLANRNRLLVITGSEAYAKNKEIAGVLKALEKSAFKITYARIGSEPTPLAIDNITAENRAILPDAIIAIGGGSSIDAGKAISAMLTVEQPVRDFLEGVGSFKHPGTKLTFIAVPTTSGTGSEATSNAVISQTGKNGFKRSIRHENFVPDMAIIDPLLVKDCPPEITAHSGMDAFTQLVESYLSIKSQPITDCLALEGITNIRDSLIDAVKDGNDILARTRMSYAALLSGITLANAGLGLVHGFASSVGAYTNIPHGIVCGTLMGVVNRFTIDKLLLQNESSVPREKYAAIGRILSRQPDLGINDAIKYTADYLDTLTETLQLKKLGAFGFTKNALPAIASVTDHKANPVRFSTGELEAMLVSRL